MPPKKNHINGFWLFAQSNRGKWKAQGLAVGNNRQLLALANPLWKSMSQDEKKSWDVHAKEERKQKKDDRAYERLDNTGNVIGSRKDPLEESRKRREKEIAETTSQWHGKDLTQEKFYFISFQDLCETTVGEDPDHRSWLPREMAIAEYCLVKGITNFYHQFIWPTSIPLGFRLKAEKRSSDYHKIPVEETERDSNDYAAIYRRVTELMRGGMREGRHPPLYCLAQDYEKTKHLCDWLWSNAGTGPRWDNPMGRVHSLEDMVCQLLAFSGNPDTENIATFQIVRSLDGSQWDYIASTPCEFHKGVDVSRYCALAFVRKAAYTVSDMVAVQYGIELCEKHVPVREEPDVPSFRFVPPTRTTPSSRGAGRGRGKKRNGGGGGGGKSYAELARPPPGRDSSDDSGTEDGSVSSSSQGSDWPRRPYSSATAGSVEKGGGARVPSAPNAPVPGQFANRPKREAKPTEDSSDESEDEDFPTPQMSALRLTEAPPSAWGGGRRGRGVAPAVAATSAPTPAVWPPPGFGSGNQHPAVPGGRGFVPEGDFCTAFRAAAPIPVGRGSMMPAPANQQAVVGRGRAAVGRGSLLGGAAQGQAFGRGRMGRGTRPGRDDTLQGEVGASGSVIIGRGVFYTGAVYGAAPQLPSFVGTGPSPPVPAFGREAVAGEREVVSSGVPGAVPSAFVVSNAGLDADTDNFEPPLPETHFTTSTSQQSFGGANSFMGGARGVVTPGSARGVTLGRGFMPAPRGRGSMPKKEAGNV